MRDMRPPQEHGNALPTTSSHPALLHDRVANLKSSSLDFAPHIGLPLHVKTSKEGRRNKASAFGERPKSRCSTPQHLLHSPLLHDGYDSFIIDLDNGSLYPPSSARLWNPADFAELGMAIKSEQLSPLCLGVGPETAALAGLMNGGHTFARHNFSQQQPNHVIRPRLSDPQAVQKFLRTAEELQQRAHRLWEEETLELERAKRLKVLQPPKPPTPLDSPDTFKMTGAGHMSHLLSSPNSMALMSCLQHQFLSSPTCYADVRLLDSKCNTPTKCVL